MLNSTGWNLAILLAAPLPSFWAYFKLHQCQHDTHLLTSCYIACKLGLLHPVLAVNMLFFANACVLFHAISLLQGSTWLIDPYWTILPLLIAHFYRGHPAANRSGARQTVAMALLWAWSLRLSHNYLRREKWALGAREDWRFTDMRQQYGIYFWIISFPLVYLSQQAMLVGLTLPFHIIHTVSTPWRLLDTAAVFVCLTGLAVAGVADTQLHRFVTVNELAAAQGRPMELILDTELWRLSRHPNYVGEMAFWWGVGLFAVAAGRPWNGLLGPLLNTVCMAKVTAMVEARMRGKVERRAAYDTYCGQTPAWLPGVSFSKSHET